MSLINNLTDKLDEMLSIFEGVFGFNEAVVAVDKLIYDALSDVICKELNIDKPYIRVKDMKPNHYGEYNPNNNCISLNKLLSPTSYMLIGEDDKALEHMSTLAHELRHVYQHKYNASILDNYVDDYVNNYKEYREQASEVDARQYQHDWCTNKKDIFEFLLSNI